MDTLRDLDERFVGNHNAIALHYATDVALACLTQCLSEADYMEYAKREPYVKQMFTDEDLRRIWKKILEMEIL